MFVCCVCLLSGRGLCVELITRPEESYRLWCVVVCDLETSWMRRLWPTGGGGLLRQQQTLVPCCCRIFMVTCRLIYLVPLQLICASLCWIAVYHYELATIIRFNYALHPLRLIVRSWLDVPTFATRRLHAYHHARAPSRGRRNGGREMLAGNFA